MTQYISLTTYLRIAAEVSGVDVDVLVVDTNLDAVRGALNACAAHYEITEVHSSLADKMTILARRLLNSRPLSGHNLPVTYEVLQEFAYLNGRTWAALAGDEDGEEVAKILRGLSDGSVSDEQFCTWINERIQEDT